MKQRMTGALKEVLSVWRVKDRIQLFYQQSARLEADLNAFKEEHGYCIGRPFCMTFVGNLSGRRKSCSACVRANSNPKYKKRISEYGKLRRKEKEEQRKAKEKQTKAA